MPFSWGITPLIAACKQKNREGHLKKKKKEKYSGMGGVENIVQGNKCTLKNKS